MQKVHGPALETPAEARHGYFDRPTLNALVVGLTTLLILYAFVYFGFFGSR